MASVLLPGALLPFRPYVHACHWNSRTDALPHARAVWETLLQPSSPCQAQSTAWATTGGSSLFWGRPRTSRADS